MRGCVLATLLGFVSSISASTITATSASGQPATITQKASISATTSDLFDPREGCENLHGASLAYCYQTIAGFNPAAASYLVKYVTDPEFVVPEGIVYFNTFFESRTEEYLYSNAPKAFSLFTSFYSDVPSNLRGYFSSVVENALSLQNGAATSTSGAVATTAPSAVGPNGAASISSRSSTAVAPRMTGVGFMMAAGFAAGVAGAAVGL